MNKYLTDQQNILNEIFIQASNQIKKIKPNENTSDARCSGVCEPGLCTFIA